MLSVRGYLSTGGFGNIYNDAAAEGRPGGEM